MTPRDLLYVSTGQYYDDVFVYTYPHGKLIGALGGDNALGLCSDRAGNVFVTAGISILEYLHGQAIPIAQLSNPFGTTYACSVDPRTGKLAGIGRFGVAVFRAESHNRWHLPKLYEPGSDLAGCAYDADGDLFVDRSNSTGYGFHLQELARGADAFTSVTVDESVSIAGSMQWDGEYLAVGDDRDTLIHRFAISGSQGTQQGTVSLSGAGYGVGQFFVKGKTLIGPENSNNVIGFWNYPGGGAAYKTISVKNPRGATISVGR
jgi:hypothetical protein